MHFFVNALCDLDPKGQIMYFFANASPPKSLDIAAQTVHVYRSHDIEGTGLHFLLTDLSNSASKTPTV